MLGDLNEVRGLGVPFARLDSRGAVQVKAWMTDGMVVGLGRFQAQVCSATFRPRDTLDMLFVLVDNVKAAWLAEH